MIVIHIKVIVSSTFHLSMHQCHLWGSQQVVAIYLTVLEQSHDVVQVCFALSYLTL